MTVEIQHRRAKASVYITSDDLPFVVQETPSEVAALVSDGIQADVALICLSLGNQSDWNGKPLYVNPRSVMAISPPKADPDEDEDED